MLLVAGAALYFAYLSRLLPFLRLRHTYDLLRGRFSNPDDPGEIPHFQALSSALSGTIGMGNIAGVAIAISMGGAGAIFWMWVAVPAGHVYQVLHLHACLHVPETRMKTVSHRAGPCILSKRDSARTSNPWPCCSPFAAWWAVYPCSRPNQLAGLLQAEWEVDRTVTGLIATVFVGAVILGGIKRVGAATSRAGAGHVHSLFLLERAGDCHPLRGRPCFVRRYLPGGIRRPGSTWRSGRAHFQGGIGDGGQARGFFQ